MGGCTHRIRRCVNSTSLRPAGSNCDSVTAPVTISSRPLGGVCPSYAQLRAALQGDGLPRNRPELVHPGVMRDMLNESSFVGVLGDSITKGSLQVGPAVDKGRRRWWYLALRWAASLVGRSDDPGSCSAARDGMSLTKMRLDLEGRGISRFYKVRESPKKLVSRCFKDKRAGRVPTAVIVLMGANDFLDGNDITSFETNLHWVLNKMQEWTGGSVRGVMLAHHPFPAVGRREELNGGVYRWRPHARAAILRAAKWAVAEGRYDWVTAPELATSLQWCQEHNFADGIHPNPRGHLLMALEAFRHMLKPSDNMMLQQQPIGLAEE